MSSQLTEIALQMLGTIERMELIIPEITDTIRKALEEKAALAAEPVTPDEGEVAELVVLIREGVAQCVEDFPEEAAMMTRAADLLSRLAPQPVPVPEVPTDDDLWAVGDENFRANCYATDAIKYARAVLARWGN